MSFTPPPRPARRRGLLLALLILALCAFDIAARQDRNSVIAIDKSGKPQSGADDPAARLSLNVGIEPPAGGSADPVTLATPAGILHQTGAVAVPGGGVLHVHLRQAADADAPQVVVDGQDTPMSADEAGQFNAAVPLADAHKVAIKRGNEVIAAWTLSPQPADPPKIRLVTPIALANGSVLHVKYEIDDSLDISKFAVRLTVANPPPGAVSDPVDMPVDITPAKHLAGEADIDLGQRGWAGPDLSVSLVATNGWGAEAVSDPARISLPARHFNDPTARMMMDERQKILDRPDDRAVVGEVADMMAALSRQVAVQHGDPALVMALREGAVRLILETGKTGVASVADILWNIATAIETSEDKAGPGGQAVSDTD